VSIKNHNGWALLQQALIMYWRIQDVWGPANLVALMAAELDDTLPHASRMYNMIVFGPPMDAHQGYHVEDSTRVR
jgi:hypothetical protein